MALLGLSPGTVGYLKTSNFPHADLFSFPEKEGISTE